MGAEQPGDGVAVTRLVAALLDALVGRFVRVDPIVFERVEVTDRAGEVTR